MAIVTNEYGNMEGIATLEDLLEEIVGEIEDEYDLPDSTLTWLDERTVEADGCRFVVHETDGPRILTVEVVFKPAEPVVVQEQAEG